MCYVIRALLNSSKVLILDEPTAALDTQSAESLRDSVMDAIDDTIQLVIITHDARPIWPEDAAHYVVVGGALQEDSGSDGRV
jgi:ABC-type sugar transport system ATPase subunit